MRASETGSRSGEAISTLTSRILHLSGGVGTGECRNLYYPWAEGCDVCTCGGGSGFGLWALGFGLWALGSGWQVSGRSSQVPALGLLGLSEGLDSPRYFRMDFFSMGSLFTL